jgi:hypothetical protein
LRAFRPHRATRQSLGPPSLSAGADGRAFSRMSLNDDIQRQLLAGLDGSATAAQLNNALRLLAKWRSLLIQNTVLQHQGTVVWQGPLKGLDFWPRSAEGCHVAKLLGCYEQPLQPFIEDALQTEYSTILNIGCAEGYYAVGMARQMPDTRILAYDLNPEAQKTCTALAEKNGVADRVTVGSLFSPSDFAAFAGARTLVMCDIEGAEQDLLDPGKAPALAGMDLIVESHDGLVPGITDVLMQRFEPTHRIEVVQDNGSRPLTDTPVWFQQLAHLDQLLATWEWRSGPTPWLVMKARSVTA